MKQPLPPLFTPTPRQTEILTLLYRFRFLSRVHIQTLLGHKNHTLIISWLNNLTTHDYTKRYFDKRLAAKPAVYSLGNSGRKYLKGSKVEGIKAVLLDRAWKESSYSEDFKEKCLLAADIYISLLNKTHQEKAKLQFRTKTDLHGTPHLLVPAPEAYIAIEQADGATIRYFLEIFGDIPPRAMRTRVREYLKYFDSDEWQDNTNKPFPHIILLCPNERLKNHLRFYIQSKVEEETDLHFHFDTSESVSIKGLSNL